MCCTSEDVKRAVEGFKKDIGDKKAKYLDSVKSEDAIKYAFDNAYFIVIRPLPSIPLCLCSSGSRRSHTASLRLRHSAAGTIPTTVRSASPA